MGHRHPRGPLPRLPRRVLGSQLRPCQPAPGGSRAGTGRDAHPRLPRLQPRAPRPVRRGPHLPHGHRDHAPHEHGCRGRGDRHQGGPQVGVPRQAHPGRPREHRGRGELVPRAHHHDHLVLHGREGPGPLRPVHARFHHRALRRRRRRRRGDDRVHGRHPHRTDTGRGGGRHPHAGLPAAPPRDRGRVGGPPHRGRDPGGPRTHGLDARPAADRGEGGPHHPRQGPGRRDHAGLRRRRAARRALADDAGHPRVHVRRQPAGRADRPRGGLDAGDGRVPAARP